MTSEPEKRHAKGEPQSIHVVAKPTGPLCNLNCEYCFYLEKQALFGPNENYRMSDDVLSAFITNYVKSQPTPVVEFVWQGGEPTSGDRFLQEGGGNPEAVLWCKDH